MKKINIMAIALTVISCLSTNIAFAEQTTAPKREFKTWSVESKTTAAKPGNEWKERLAASAAKKQAAAKSAEAGAPKQAVATNSTAAQPKQRLANSKNDKAALKAAAKEKQRKAKLKNKQKTTKPTEKGKSSYGEGWKLKMAQQRLKQLGYMSEPATGKMTEATKVALEKFQREQKQSVTGKLDENTYRKLEWLAFSRNGIKNITGAAVVKEAAKYKGVKYVFGGTTPKGFDCSGYVQYVFKQLNARVSRTADTQVLEGVFVTQRQLKPGDIVFFSTYEPGASHCGIYAGNGKFWNATSSKGIALCGLQEDYWRTRYYGARRFLVSNGEPTI